MSPGRKRTLTRRDFLTETAAGLGAATAGLRLAGGDEKAGRPGREALIGFRLNSDVPEIGSFSCSNDLLIRIQEMCRGTFLSNIFSVQSDCPHRERFGYGGDLVATSDTVLLNFDMANFYAKAALDWQDAARPDGMLTDTAPFVGIQYCGLACAMAHPVIQSQLLRYVGDRRLIEQQYETTRRWFELVARENPDFIVREGLADHESLETTGVPFLVTPLYFQTAETASWLAGTLGRREDEARWAGLAASIRKAYLQSVLPPGPGRYASATQAAMAMALVPDLLPETEKGPAFEALLAKTVSPEGPRLMNSIFGTKWLLEALSASGRADVAYDLVNRSSFPGWGYMLEKGATTLWEHWAFSDDTFSHNHPMFGSVTEWFV
ncbi:MAG: twin-arginine translocation signal domain-containing protein [Candidatus Aminicenantes bacterium]|nr:twin-arginine translocation signal domain-containing protein [Candidatus Aminicenantes bacterium]